MRPNPNTDTHLETQLVDDDESITNLTENIEKYKRDSSSICSGQGMPQQLESESDEESEEIENPFLTQKQKDDSHQSFLEDSDDESIFDKLRDEVQQQLYTGQGGRAVVNRFRDSRVEVMSN